MPASFIAIAVQRITEGVLQWLKPGLKVLPLIQAFTKYRLADLFGTGGAYAAFGLVELDALRLKCKPAEVEHSPHVALKIVDDILVMYAQHAPRQHPIPVAHQFQIGAVVTCDILDAVSE